jgi:mercuric ion binding protein
MKAYNRISLITVLVLLFMGMHFAQARPATPPKNKFSKVMIHTSAICGDCKSRIEGALKKVKGVKSANLDLETKDVTVTYAPKKVDVPALRKAISQAGYDADEVLANQEAYDNLPMCCRKGGHD